MNFKTILYSTVFALAFIFIACDDDLSTIGQGIQPPSDEIGFQVDSVYFKARTVSLDDAVYARTVNGLLGKYDDDIFGTVKSDYLCEFYCPDGTDFHPNLIEIDSAQIWIRFSSYIGDTLSPMGLSVYEVNNALTENFYTNVDPSEYCDMSLPLAKMAFTIAGTPYYSSTVYQKVLKADLGTGFGQRFYDAYKSENNPFVSSEEFNKFFKGTYITTDFGTGSLSQVASTTLNIYYKYNDIKGNWDNTTDTIRSGALVLSATEEIIQLNHIQNKIPDDLLVEGTGASYIKSPAGVCTELTLPLQEIMNRLRDENGVIDTEKAINMAKFSIKGYTEKEPSASSDLITPSRVSTLLFIDRDSVSTYFVDKGYLMTDSKYYTSLVSRTPSTNSFEFGNISTILTHYIKNYQELGITKDPVFLLLPVSISTSSSGSRIGVYNYMSPASSIIRTDEDNLKLKILSTKL